MKKNKLLIFMLFISIMLNSINIYANISINHAIGKLWLERKALGIYSVNEEDGIIKIEVSKSIDKESLKRINELSEGFDLEYSSSISDIPEGKKLNSYFLNIDTSDISMDDKLFTLKKQAYVSNGVLMLPIREITTSLDKIANINFKIMYKGGENNVFEITSIAGRTISISIKNNTITDTVSGEVYYLDNPIILVDGTAYLPYSKENFKLIFNESNYDKDKKTLHFIV